MSDDRDVPVARRAGFRRRLALGLLLTLGGCGEPEAETARPDIVEEARPLSQDGAAGVAPSVAPPATATAAQASAPAAPGAVSGPAAAEPAAPEEPAAPAPDLEAQARARAEAARERFEREYPWHGVAYHFLSQVRARPDGRSPVIGYMRRGAQFRAKPPLRGHGCDRGWSEVPGGGYVCRGQGFALGDTPQTFDPSPVGAALDDALPYAYAWVVRDDAPQYWRLPSRAEEERARAWIQRQRAQEERAEAERSAPSAAAAAPEAPTGADAEPEAASDEAASDEAASDEAASDEAPSDEAASDEAPEPDLEAPPGLGETVEQAEAGADERPAAGDAGTPSTADERPSFLRMRMRRGFYVSIDRLETLDGRRFYRTVRGGYVPVDAVAEASPPSMRGVVLGGRWTLPLGFVYRGGVRSLTRDSVRGVLQLAEPVERLTPLPLQREVITRRSRRYRVSDRGRIVREDALRLARSRPRPPEIPADARWIHVDLDQQVLVAYEGERPVFATLVSTGRQGYETPVGTFRIQSKHVSTTMDDPDAGAEAYSIEDVPWTMYFQDSYALHGAFWHDRFGRVRSHGCVNLAPADARWIFQWSEPSVPASWHGASAVAGREGTWVHVTSDR